MMCLSRHLSVKDMRYALTFELLVRLDHGHSMILHGNIFTNLKVAIAVQLQLILPCFLPLKLASVIKCVYLNVAST